MRTPAPRKKARRSAGLPRLEEARVRGRAPRPGQGVGAARKGRSSATFQLAGELVEDLFHPLPAQAPDLFRRQLGGRFLDGPGTGARETAVDLGGGDYR